MTEIPAEYRERIREKLAGVRCFLLDMDGTFYLGDRLIDGSLDFLAALEKTGRTARFLTNNSSKSASVYAEKLRRIVCFACTAASLSTQKHGGIASVPEETDVQAKMAE